MDGHIESNTSVSEYSLLTIKEGKQLIDCLEKERGLPKAEMAALMGTNCSELRDYARFLPSLLRN